MRASLVAVTAVLLQSTAALQLTRRQLAAAVGAGTLAPATARADVPVDPFNSMCFGFGCAPAQGVDSLGAPAPTDEDSIPWKQALELIDAKKVKSVEFDDVAMDKCYVVTADGRFRVGEGYPIKNGRSWSGPLFVTRILDNNQIPRSYIGGLKRRSSYKE